jgi:hypothetical protein
MEDRVEHLHQGRVQQRRRFCTVQDPLVHALMREKATSCNMHPDVLAQKWRQQIWGTSKNSQKKRLM